MLYKKLVKYVHSGIYPMHMPGHKRNPEFFPVGMLPYSDITEIHEFDDLHNPQGVLEETQKLAASLYKSRESFMLINGSTAGVLAAIGAHTSRGDKILADESCHRSVPNAAALFGLELICIPRRVDECSGVMCSVTVKDVKSSLRSNTDIKLVVITSPTYEGVISDITQIADAVHEAGALLLVDCAHGAHLGFSQGFPESPVTLGVDVAVTSLHKTLPALTQCSLLHVCSNRADTVAIKKMLGILQTSSPSYVLMSSTDYCLRLLDSDAAVLFSNYENNLMLFYDRISSLKHMFVLRRSPRFFDFDPGKIVIITKNSPYSGFQLSEVLRKKYSLELEKATADYAIAMTSICDTRDGFSRLADALIEIDGRICLK